MQPHDGQRWSYTQSSVLLAPQTPRLWIHQNQRTGATDHYALSTVSMVVCLFQFVETDVNYCSDRELSRESFSLLPTRPLGLNGPSFPRQRFRLHNPQSRSPPSRITLCILASLVSVVASLRCPQRTTPLVATERCGITPTASRRSRPPAFNILARRPRTHNALEPDHLFQGLPTSSRDAREPTTPRLFNSHSQKMQGGALESAHLPARDY